MPVYRVKFTLRSYIGKPMSPERNAVIDITKKSGTNRARSEAKAAAALSGYLDKIGMAREEYDALVKRANEPWYRGPDGGIIIPRHVLCGMLVETVKRACVVNSTRTVSGRRSR